MNEEKHILDLGVFGIMAATFAGLLPAIAAAVAVVYYSIQIWESDTVKKMTGRKTD